MPGLREDITKTFRRFGRRDWTIQAARAETQLATDPREGKDFGAYRILRRLGFGGMGQVYLSLDTRLGRHVALKFLDDRLVSDPTMLDRLYQEARTASSLNHPNILTIHEIGEAQGEHFIASEYVEGITIGDAIDRKLVTPKMSIEVATQVASALIAAHAAGVIHRDLKATNIMIRPDGLVKVIDFGLAKRSEERLSAAAAAGEHHRPLSALGGIAGTVEYMSPEQARGETVDHRTDLWSLGVVLYEMLVGKFPFAGATEGHVIGAILEQPATVIENASSLPRGVTEIIERALTKDRNKRYQSAGEMLRDLQSLDLTKQRISATKRFAVLTESKPLVKIAMPAAAFVAVASAFAIWWISFDGKESLFGPEWFEPGPPEQITFNGKVDNAAISPDGKFLAYTSRERGKGVLHIRNVAAKSEWQLPPYSETTLGLTFAPDSKSLYYVLHDQREFGRLYGLDIHGGVPRVLIDDIDGPVTFSPDGRRFAFLRRFEEGQTSANKIIVAGVDDTGNQHEIVSKVGTNIERQLAWSAKNNQIATVVFSDGLHSSLRGDLFLFRPDGTTRNTPIKGAEMRTMQSPIWIPGSNVIAFSGITDWRTNQQAGLYEIAAGTRELRAFPSAPFVDMLSTTRNGDAIAAIQMTRKTSFWVTEPGSFEALRQIVPAAHVDTGSFDGFSWDGEDGLVFPSTQPRAINLMRLSLSGQTAKLSNAQGCAEREPAYVAAQPVVIYSSNCTTFGNARNIWRLNWKTGERTPLTGGLTRDEQPDVSRDGKWIVYSANPSNVSSLWKLPVSGGTAQQFSRLQAWLPSISPDGDSVLCQIRESYDGRVRYAILSLLNGDVQQELWDLPISRVRARWEPSGKAIDFVDQEGTSIWRKPLASGPPVMITPQTSDPITDFSWNPAGNKLAFTTVHTNNDVIFIHRKPNR